MSPSGGWFDVAARIAGLRGQTVHVLPAAAEGRVRGELEAAGFRVVTVMGAAASGPAHFVAEVARAVALEETFGRNWDECTDALGDEGSARLAVVWTEAQRSVAGDLQTVLDAVVAFDRAAGDRAQEDPPRQLEVFLLVSGEGLAGA
jgi:hypothetical protein